MLKKVLIFIIVAFFFPCKGVFSQTQPVPKWRISVGFGQYSAKIGLPDFSAIHPGFLLGASYRYNNNARHQLRQQFNMTGIYHAHFQTAIQLYTELQYEWHINDRFFLAPFGFGGGYLASFADMPGFEWDGTQYVNESFPLRNNFLVSLGPTLGFKPAWSRAGYPVSLLFGYRMQIQGIIVQTTVPMVVYSSWQLSAAISF
ncbi:MAG TPA: hypothetical protein PLU49_02420 [Saprospiraceae bacterium]|nr:hypothetical protein [Saprospiraceae bacterium]